MGDRAHGGRPLTKRTADEPKPARPKFDFVAASFRTRALTVQSPDNRSLTVAALTAHPSRDR